MLRNTLSTWNPTAGLIMPVARSAEPSATRGNWSNSPGRNQSR